MTEAEWAWLGGLFEGEGCIAWTGKNSVTLTVNMTDRDVVERVLSATATGRLRGPYRLREKVKPMWSWGDSS